MVWAYVLWGVLSAFILHRYLAYRAAEESVAGAPGMRMVLRGGTVLSYLLPKHKFLNPGMRHMWKKKHDSEFEAWVYSSRCGLTSSPIQVFAQAGADIITNVAAFPVGASVVVADPTVLKVCTKKVITRNEAYTKHSMQDITTHRALYPKPLRHYRPLTLFGQNIVATEGNE